MKPRLHLHLRLARATHPTTLAAAQDGNPTTARGIEIETGNVASCRFFDSILDSAASGAEVAAKTESQCQSKNSEETGIDARDFDHGAKRSEAERGRRGGGGETKGRRRKETRKLMKHKHYFLEAHTEAKHKQKHHKAVPKQQRKRKI